MAEIDIIIAGRPYKVACRDGEEETLVVYRRGQHHPAMAVNLLVRHDDGIVESRASTAVPSTT